MPISGSTYDFNWSNVNNAPVQHGVYILYQAGRVTYIGHAADPGVNLRTRLQAHIRGDLGTSTQGTTAFQTEATADSVDAANRERNLRWDFEHVNGRPPRCNDPLSKYG